MAKQSDSDLFRRAIKFETLIMREMAERVVPFEVGFALIDSRVPLVPSLNELLHHDARVPRRRGALRARRRLHRRGGDGAPHDRGPRRRGGAAAAAGPGGAGYETEVSVFMALKREPDRPPEAEAKEVRYEEKGDLRAALLAENPRIPAPRWRRS